MVGSANSFFFNFCGYNFYKEVVRGNFESYTVLYLVLYTVYSIIYSIQYSIIFSIIYSIQYSIIFSIIYSIIFKVIQLEPILRNLENVNFTLWSNGNHTLVFPTVTNKHYTPKKMN
jgi:hypothetical protein